MELPDKNTIKILEKRKEFLINRNQTITRGNSYAMAEISAIDKTINFIKLMQNDFVEDFMKKIISENELKNNSEDDDDENKYKTLYSFEEYLAKKIKLDISYIQYNENKHIVLSLRRYKKDLFKWAYQGKIITTIETLEKIMKKAKEIWEQ